jgi:hypothetical protein
LLFTLIALLVTGCNFETLEIGPLERKTVAIQMAAADPAVADTVAAEISMGIGNLKVGGAETSLLEAIFTYNVVEWEPEVEYLVSDAIGHLTVRQPTNRNSIPTNLGDVHYEWDLQLSREVPINLSITLGAGEGDLNLSELNLSSLEYKGGAGSVYIDLRGSTINKLDVALGAGDATLDMSGQWRQDVQATVKGGVGRVMLILPGTTGVRVETQGVLSRINARDFDQENGVYTNDAYGKSANSININIEAGIGEIVLELAG